MTTYNSYEAAKIANPDSGIYKAAGVFGDYFNVKSLGGKVETCNPADHCMRYDDFLTLGHRFIDGDEFLNSRGEVVIITNSQSNNRIIDGDEKRFVLRAAALEEKKPRTKVEHVKCEFSREWEAVKYYNEEGELFVIDCNGNYSNVNDISGAWYEVVCKNYDNIYRRIETPITEREAFVEALQELWIIDGVDGQEQMDKIVDSGKFKIANQDSDLLRSRIRAVAEWEMNTSNNHDWESVAESIYCAVDDLLKS